MSKIKVESNQEVRIVIDGHTVALTIQEARDLRDALNRELRETPPPIIIKEVERIKDYADKWPHTIPYNPIPPYNPDYPMPTIWCCSQTTNTSAPNQT